MEPEVTREYYNQAEVVKHYTHAAANVGLWISEEKVFNRVFKREDSILELGTGAGRIAIGLHEIGFKNVIGVDIAPEMIAAARRAAKILEYPVPFRVGDATRLNFGDELFEGAIFGFNGLMQIPQQENRRKALGEICRVLKPGGWFVFTAHDRELQARKRFWAKERLLWRSGKQKKEIDQYGDLYEPTEYGNMFIHVPTSDEMRKELKSAGFRVEADVLRSQLANEPVRVRTFSDECRFWVAQKL